MTKPKTKKKRARASPDDDRRSLSRLERILLLVPYCVRNPGVSVSELAQRFDATDADIIEDLNLVFVCGLPEYTPADLMDVTWEGDRVVIRMADYFSRPLRLTRSEAIPLYVKARALVDLMRNRDGASGLEELGSLESALTKLASALLPQDGGVAELTEKIKVHLEAGEARWLPVLREAVTQCRRVDVEYFTYSRDTLTRRKVDPYLVFESLGHWYVSGYCHLAADRRIFRLDRIKSIEVTQEMFERPEDASEDLPPPMLYTAGPEDATVTLRVSKGASLWLQEYLPVESTKELRGGWKELVFRTSAFPWLEKLLLRFGPDVKVVGPPELQERVRDAAGRILALYKPGSRKH